MEIKKERRYNIDFLRFVFALMIAYYHLMISLSAQFKKNEMLQLLTNYSRNVGGSIVIAFFVISGFFLCNTAVKSTFSFSEYVKRRILRLWPLLALSFVPFIFFKTFSIEDLLNIFFLDSGMGITKTLSHNPATWFVCVDFWLVMLLYFVVKRYGRRILSASAVISMLSFIWLGQSSNTTYNVIAFATLQLTCGVCYALAGLNLGIIFYFFLDSLKSDKTIASQHKFLFSILELTFLCSTLYFLLFHKTLKSRIFVWCLPIFLIFLFFQNIGYISNFFNKKLFGKLGSLSYAIYTLHYPAIVIIRTFFVRSDTNLRARYILLIYLLIFVALGGGGYLFDKCLRSFIKKIKKFNQF